MRLLLVELTRFRSRRAIVLLLLAATLFAGFLALSTLWDTRPLSAGDRAAAVAQAERDAAEPSFQRELRRCERHPERYLGPDTPADLCEEQMMPQPEWYLYRSELSLHEEKGDTGLGVLLVVAGIMIIIGTTFAGADWASGSVSNQVLFEPRRTRVWLAKAGAVLGATLVASAVIVGLFWAALHLVARSRGIETGASVQDEIRWMAGRGVLLAGAGALGGYALTMLVRHTVGTLAIMFGYAIAGEALTAALPVEGAGRWGLSHNVFAWLRDGYQYYDPRLECPRGPGTCEQLARLSLADGAAYLGVTLLVVIVLSMLLFRRRDIP